MYRTAPKAASKQLCLPSTSGGCRRHVAQNCGAQDAREQFSPSAVNAVDGIYEALTEVTAGGARSGQSVGDSVSPEVTT